MISSSLICVILLPVNKMQVDFALYFTLYFEMCHYTTNSASIYLLSASEKKKERDECCENKENYLS